jgi:ubiquitin-conjugating enzyme E2 H
MKDTQSAVLIPAAEYVSKYASKEAADEGGEDSESEDELSSVGSYESGGEEPVGTMDDV